MVLGVQNPQQTADFAPAVLLGGRENDLRFTNFFFFFFTDRLRPLLKVKVKVKSLSGVQPFATPWTVAYQASLSMGFSRQEYWSGLPFPFPEDFFF